MTFNEKKEYLSQYIPLKQYLNNLGGKPVIRENLDLFDDMTKNIIVQTDKIENEIKKVEDITLRNILLYKYIVGHSLMKIAELINYSTRHTQRLYKKAIEEFEVEE